MDFSLDNSEIFGEFRPEKGEAFIYLSVFKKYKMSEEKMIKFIIATISHESLHCAVHSLFYREDATKIDRFYYKMAQIWIEDFECKTTTFIERSYDLFRHGYLSAFELIHRLSKIDSNKIIEL